METGTEQRFQEILEEMSGKNKFDVPDGRDKSSGYQLKKVNQMHREIIRFIVLGYRDKEIAEALGCTTVTVKNVKESELAQRYIREMQGERDSNAVDLSTTIKNIAPLALEISTGIMMDDDASESVRANIAADILDRAGYKPANINMNLGGGLTKDEIREIRERAQQNGLKVRSEHSEVQEAEYTDANNEEGGSGDGTSDKDS